MQDQAKYSTESSDRESSKDSLKDRKLVILSKKSKGIKKTQNAFKCAKCGISTFSKLKKTLKSEKLLAGDSLRFFSLRWIQVNH
jgi:hypothetical protein